MEKHIPEGYKQTEVGMIPEDWEVRFLKDISSMKSGMNITEKRLSLKGKYPCYGGNGLRGFTDTYNHNGEFVLIGRQGALCGNVLFAKGIFFASEHAVVVSAFNNVNVKWLTYVLDRMKLNQYSESSAQPGLSVTKILKLEIGMPLRIKEQHAIATALSNVDNLITSLEQLIEKKKAIKQGAMQELLTGRRRLKGFGEGKGYKQTELGIIPEHWEYKKLKRLVVDFVVPMRDKPKKFSGEIPWCRIEDFNGKYLEESKTQKCVSSDTIQEMNLRINQRDTLLVSCSADLGRCAIVKKPLVTNQTFIGLVFNDLIADVEFFYYLMGNYSSELNMLSSGTTISYLSREQFEEFEVFYPINKLEQSAIANVLSDLDSEIEDLGTKADKYRQIKQGMMQNLLTGRIRLV